MSQANTQDQLNEQEIQFKKRARRRLVGAIALVLIMVAVLPMVLDDRASKAPQQDIAISIPSQDGAEFTSKIVPVAPESATTQLPVSPDSQAKLAEKVEVAASEPVTAETKTPKVTENVAKPEIVKPVQGKNEVSKNEALKKEPPTKLTEDKKSPETTSAGNVYVQIGVFSDIANVKQLQQKLSSLGLKSYTEKIDTPKGEKTRLRVGPFSSKVEAENALAKVKSIGLAGMVVAK